MIASGSQIRAARAGLGWSQEELAGRAGIHAKAVAYWERMQEAVAGIEGHGQTRQ